MSNVKVALRVLAGIQAIAPTAIIAGGCARDIAHGVKPKDFDIVVPLGTDLGALKAYVKEVAVDGSYRAFVFDRDGDGGYSEDDRVILCLKATVDSVDFDVLLYNVTEDALKAVAYFDFNLNQYVLRKDGTARFAGDTHPNEGLIEIRGDASEVRREYIRNKHKAFYPERYEE